MNVERSKLEKHCEEKRKEQAKLEKELAPFLAKVRPYENAGKRSLERVKPDDLKALQEAEDKPEQVVTVCKTLCMLLAMNDISHESPYDIINRCKNFDWEKVTNDTFNKVCERTRAIDIDADNDTVLQAFPAALHLSKWTTGMSHWNEGIIPIRPKMKLFE